MSFGIPLHVRMTPTLRFTGIERTLDRLANVEQPLKSRGVALVRERAKAEQDGRVWFPPGGGAIPWAPRVPFGDREPSSGRGDLYRALTQGGAGAIEEVGPHGMRVGIDGAAFPYAAALRGGSGGRINTADVYVKPKKRANVRSTTKSGKPTPYQWQWAMFWYLGLTYGVWLSAETMKRGLRIPVRPYLTKHPILVKGLTRILVDWVRTGEA